MSFHVSCWNTVRDFVTRVECVVLFVQEPKLVGDARRDAGSLVLEARLEIFSRGASGNLGHTFGGVSVVWMQRVGNLIRVTSDIKNTTRFSFKSCLNLILF